MLGCPLPLSAGGQKEIFQALVEETLGNTCDIETVKNIHEKEYQSRGRTCKDGNTVDEL